MVREYVGGKGAVIIAKSCIISQIEHLIKYMMITLTTKRSLQHTHKKMRI